MHLEVPNGYFVEQYCLWGDPYAGSVLSRIYAADFPDLWAADDQAFINLENDMRLMLGCLKSDERLQLLYYTGNDFCGVLERFAQETKKHSRIEICSKVRDELVSRFRDRMARETLIQANVRLCLSTKMPKFAKEDGRKVRGFQDVFRVLARSFEQRAQFFDLLLRSYGGSVNGLDNAGHYEELLRFWSPGQARQPRFKDLDWLRTIEDLCRFSGLSPRHEPNHGFYMDGFYFGLLVAKTMPRNTWARTMEPFLALTVPNLRVVINMQPLAIEAEVRHEEERFNKLMSNLDPRSPSLQSEVGLDKHRERMRLLMSNKVIPFKAQLIVIVCDRTPDGLDARMEALRAALGKTGCEPFQPSVPTALVAFFNCATPGVGPWINYPDFWHKMDDAVNVANMWPAGSTPRADLDNADWIADGDQNNLIGGRCFHGAQAVHMLCAASTGYGKSSLLQAMALQTAPSFKFIVVIDDGLSWMTTCHKLDPTSRPIMVRADGSLTFNVFDTRRLPLSSQHLASATALCHLLVGTNSDEDKDKLRHAILADTIAELYAVAYRKWRNAHPADHYDLCSKACALVKFQKRQSCDSFVDAFLEERSAIADGLGDIEVSEDEAHDLDRNPKTEHIVRNLAFASWTPEMFPTLSDLQDELHSASIQKGPHQELCAMLASLLRPWLRDGLHGPLVDGAGNIDLGSVQMSESDPLKVVHFELEKISKADAELRAVVGFLITNEVRNHIQGMPRHIRKQVVIEEMISFLKIPNGAEIAIDYYERMRKYSCQVISVFQSYTTLLEINPKVAKALISNSSALLLLGNHNRQDLDTLSGFLPKPGLPEVIKDQITRFPKPSELKAEDRYAGFVYAQLAGREPKFTVGRNYISQEVERITSSSGDVFEAKRTELRNNVRTSSGNRQNGEHDAVSSRQTGVNK